MHMHTHCGRLSLCLHIFTVSLTLSGGLLPDAWVAAAPIAVTSLADPGTGGCTPKECTLREALAAAQAGDTITFAPALFARGPGRILLTAGELVLTTDLTLQGPGGRRLTLDGNQASRVLRIAAGVEVTIA